LAKLILNGATSGSITLESPAVSGTTTLTLPTTSGTVITTGSTFAGTGPAFSASQTSDQTIASGDTAVLTQVGTELFDTASCFNNTGSTVGGIPAYAFLPNVAGYYQVNAKTYITRGSGNVYSFVAIYKNGSTWATGSYVFSVNAIDAHSMVSELIYLNGTTDYIQMYSQAASASSTIKASKDRTYFSAAMVRSA
jgi:hypothetical protein